MRKIDRIIAHFGPSVALPVAAVLVGASAMVIVSLGELANEVNRIEDRQTERSVTAAADVLLRRVAETHRDYSVWDDAARRLYGEIDQDFVNEGYVDATIQALFFDTFYVIDDSGHDLLGYHDGERLTKDSAQTYGAALDKMIAELPLDGTAYDVRTGFLETEWGVAAVAVGPIVPFSKSFQPRPNAARLLVISRLFDQEVATRLGADFLIDDFRLVDPATAGPLARPIIDPTGRAIGALSWSSREPGNEAKARISPFVIGMLVLVGIAMMILLAIARRSVAEIKRRGAEARYAATHDALTGLPNRAAAVGVVGKAISERADGEPVAVVYIDVELFKQIVGSYGHDTGDHLLREFASLLRACAGKNALAKVGDDEFVIVVADRQATKIACDIGWQLIDSLAEPFEIDGRVIAVEVNIGIAVADTTSPTADELIRRADVAMDQAKKQSSNRFVLYDPVIDTVRHERLAIADDLRRAMRNDGLTLLYQPIFSAETGEAVAVEAQLRWDRPIFGPIMPDQFVPIAEETGLIDELTRWTLHRACADARDWPGIRLSVNISPVQFRDPNFDDVVAAVLAKSDFPANRLELEVIESDVLVEPGQARRTLDAVRGLGIAIACDDFGTGYSSIEYLRTQALDKVKLDRSIVVGIQTSEKTKQLVHATVALARSLDLQVSVGGVESTIEAKLLSQAGCQELQGDVLAAACPAAEVADLLGSLAASRSLYAIA